jgi:hypothetical protein
MMSNSSTKRHIDGIWLHRILKGANPGDLPFGRALGGKKRVHADRVIE